MKPTIPRKASVLLLISALTIGASASAATIYNNTVNDLNLRFGPTTQFGDEIILAGTSQQRILTNFSFEFWALNNGTTNPLGFSPVASAEIKFYLNDGPLSPVSGYATPGTVFFQSGTFLLQRPTDRSTFNFTAGVDFPAGGLFMPLGGANNMTWTVQFSGLDLDDTAGLDVYSPPVVGSSPALQNGRIDDYWEFTSGTWLLKTNGFTQMNFAARFDATVPEPSTVALGVIGGLGFLVFRRRFAKASR